MRLAIAAGLACLAMVPAAASPAPVRAATCTAWNSTILPPPTINVYRYSMGVIQTVDFETYVKVVMAAEWPSYWPLETLRAGAVAVKQYGWNRALHPRLNKAGNCFDVYDDSDDQIYTPEQHTPQPSQIQAVETTWLESLLKNGAFFGTRYGPDYPPVVCGTDKNGYILYQQSAKQCGLDGKTGEEILAIYYYPNLVIQNAPVAPGPPLSVRGTAGDEAVQVSWQPPTSDGNAAITGYAVTSSPDAKTCATSGATTCTVGGLTNGKPYTFTVTATNMAGTGKPSAPSAAVTPVPVPGDTYTPINPVRLIDTRTGPKPQPLAANTPFTFAVSGQMGIPANAVAITGNLTTTNSTGGWAIYLGPVATASPTTSTINFVRGETTSNGVTVALASDGKLSATFLSGAGSTTDMVLDVTGYYTAAATGATYYLITPARLLDTRYRNGLDSRLVANTPADFQVSGRSGIPAGAVAVSGNLTVTSPTSGWAAYLGPEKLANPTTSTINFLTGQTRANNLVVALTATGRLWATFMSQPQQTTDLVFDVTGYYSAGAGGATYVPIIPARLVDSRVANGLSAKVAQGTPGTFPVGGRGGVPTRAIGVTGNVTVVDQTSGWALYLGPEAKSPPATSTVNFVRGDVRANGLAVALARDGTLSAWYLSNPGNTTDVVFDVTGYFEVPIAP